MKHIKFKTIDSTNTYLKENYLKLKDLTVISAKHQNNGKGRLGKAWLDDGNSALFSILIKKGPSLNLLNQVPLMAAVAAHKVLHPLILDLKIKWPNDLMVNDKKVAGILVESIMTHQKVDALIIGFGINVSTLKFNDELKESATSLLLETNQTIMISWVIKKIYRQLKKELKLSALSPIDIINYCNTYGSLNNEMISYTINGQTLSAKALNIANDGSLLIKSSNGLEHLSSGLTSLIKIKLD